MASGEGFGSPLCPTWTPNDNEFVAENETIEIVPFFSSKALHFLQGDYGPFKPNKRSKVPIWLAITLHKSKKCRILQPEWMTKESLKNYYERERSSDLFEPLPFYYREISKILLSPNNKCFGSDVIDELSILIQDIEDIRNNKLRNGLKRIDHESTLVHLTNIAAIEISSIRHNACQLLDKFDILKNGKMGKFDLNKETINHDNGNDDNNSVVNGNMDDEKQMSGMNRMSQMSQMSNRSNNNNNNSNNSSDNLHTPLSNITNARNNRNGRNIIPTQYVARNKHGIQQRYNNNNNNNRNDNNNNNNNNENDNNHSIMDDTQDSQETDLTHDSQFGVKQRSLRRLRK